MKKHLTGYLTATAILILLALALVACGGAAPEAVTPAEETAPAEEAAEEPAAEEPAAEGGMMTEIGLQDWGVRHGLATKLVMMPFDQLDAQGYQKGPPELGSERFDVPRSLALYDDVYSFRGYRDREARREADKLVREHGARELEKIVRELHEHAAKAALDELEDVQDVVSQAEKLQRELRFAERGYSGFFDDVKLEAKIWDAIERRLGERKD